VAGGCLLGAVDTDSDVTMSDCCGVVGGDREIFNNTGSMIRR
jgi:hypothetical protein